MSEETTQAPAPGGDSQETKKQTVRISLPPKPAAAPTIKIAVPSAGAAKTADGGKAASTIKKIDSHTVHFISKKPYPLMAVDLSNVHIVSANEKDKWEGEYNNGNLLLRG